jgi:electron transport complex protein RnfC
VNGRNQSLAARRGPGLALTPGPTRLPTERLHQPPPSVPLPDRLYLPLRARNGSVLEPCLPVGQQVLTDQRVCEPVEDTGATAVHAPTSGRIAGVELREGAESGNAVPCLVIEVDHQDRRSAPLPPIAAPEQAEAASLCERIRAAGISGLGGAMFPTAEKLQAAGTHPLDTLIVNGAECDPYVNCDEVLMSSAADRVVGGARALLQALRLERCLLAVEVDKAVALAALAAAIEATQDARIALVTVPARYPEGGERQLVKRLLGREVPSGGLPLDIGCICLNVATAAAVHDAVVDGRPLTSRIVTVTGPGVVRPGNFLVRLGTPVSDVIAAAGGYTPGVDRLLMGGAMMGQSLPSDEVPVTLATNALLALTNAVAVRDGEAAMPCIRCGDCAAVCPAGLQPQELHRLLAAHDLDGAGGLAVIDCIECGCCDLVCPSGILLTDSFRHARSALFTLEGARERSRYWRERHQAHSTRLANGDRAEAARLSRRSAHREQGADDRGLPAAADPTNAQAMPPRTEARRQAEIRAAVERARARRARLEAPADRDGEDDDAV